MIAKKKRSDLTDLVSAAIKSTFNTRSPGGVDRCVDVLVQLKSLSLSVKDITELSGTIFKLESLRTHRSPKIRKESQALFDSWLVTLYAQGRDKSQKKAGLNKLRLKPKMAGLARCSELKKKEERRSVAREAEEIKKKREEERSHTHRAVETKKEEKTCFLELKKKEDERSLTHQTDKVKKEAKTNLLESKKKEDKKTLTREAVVKTEKVTKTDACKSVTKKQPCGAVKDAGNQKMCSVTATALPRNIKDRDGQVTSKTLIPPPRRDATCKNIPRRTVHTTNQQQTGPARDSANPKSAALKTKREEMVELFEVAKKAGDLANSSVIEVSRCVEALSLLMQINVTPKPKEERRMMERLERLTKHKYHKICNCASALLHLWRQRIREEERRESATNRFSNNRRICGRGFTRESTKTRKSVM